MEFMNENAAFSKVLKYMEEKTSIPCTIQFCILIAVTGLWLMFGKGAAVLCNLIGFVYPAYKSMRVIESAGKEDATLWMAYWAVFGFFACVDPLLVHVLDRLRFYYLIKTMVLVWCYLPIEHSGINVFYNFFVGYYVKYYHEIIALMKAIRRWMEVLMQALSENGKAVAEAGKNMGARVTERSREAASRVAEAGKEAASKMAEKGREIVAKVNGTRRRNSAVVLG